MVEAVAGLDRDRAEGAADLNPGRLAADDTPDGFDLLILIGLMALVTLPSLAMGAVAPWARNAVLCVSIVLFALWLIQAACRGRLRLVRTWAWVFILGFFGVGLLQLVPLPPRILGVISPGTEATYRVVLPPGADVSRPLSLFPYGTRTALLRLASLALVFFLVVHVVRTRRQVTAIVLALVAVGLFQVLYGLGEHFSGSSRVFWNVRDAHLAAVTGTFINKNHFAGLLEMIVPVALGVSLGTLPRRRRGGMTRAHAVEALSSARTFLPLVMAVSVVVMAVGVCFSLSRAGIISTIVSLIAFALCLGLSTGFRRYTLVLLLVVMAILLLAVGIGAEIVVNRLEDVASARSASWADRLDMAGSGLHILAQFPIVGTGLGSFRHTFERFQSTRFGDRIVDYLHNDWLQVFCETGFVGGAIVLVGMVLFLSGTARAALSRRDAFSRLTSIGALLGAVAMLVHSFFDYNLTKITSNGVVFAVILGLAYSVARMPSETRGSTERRRCWTFPLGGRPARVGLGVCAVAAGVFLLFWPIRLARADIAFNRFLAASGLNHSENYFFIPNSGGLSDATADGMLARARRLDPGNPRYSYYGSLHLAAEAESRVRERAAANALSLMPPEVARRRPEVVERLAQALALDRRAQSTPGCARLLRESERRIRRALELHPVSARNNLLMAYVLSARTETESVRDSDKKAVVDSPIPYAGRAVWLAPTRPNALFNAGKIILQQDGLTGKPADEGEDILKALEMFRRAIFADPTYADKVYPIVGSIRGRNEALLSVTPKSLPAYKRLARTLWEEGAWDVLLVCLREMEALCREYGSAGPGTPWSLAEHGLTAHEDSGSQEDSFRGTISKTAWHQAPDLLRTRLWVAQRRCTVLGILGRWAERAKAVQGYRTLLRKELVGELAKAHSLQSRRRYSEAADVCREILQQDWASPEALLTAAEIACDTKRLSVAPYWESALDHLYRLIIYNQTLTPQTMRRVRGIIERLKPETEADRLVADFILGAGAILCGETQEGIAALEKLARRTDETAAVWRQRHLIWYYLGSGYEKSDEKDRAVAAYRHALQIVPTHKAALVRLSFLGVDVTAELKALTPAVRCNVDFGGKITLLGYTLSKETVPVGAGVTDGREKWFMTYYWQFTDRMFRDYHPAVHFCDENWRISFQDDHMIQHGRGHYAVDFARAGEAIVEKRAMDDDLLLTRYLKLSMFVPTTGGHESLYSDVGPLVFRSRLPRDSELP